MSDSKDTKEPERENTALLLHKLEQVTAEQSTQRRELKAFANEVSSENKARHQVQDTMSRAITAVADSNQALQTTMQTIAKACSQMQLAMSKYDQRAEVMEKALAANDEQLGTLRVICERLDNVVTGSEKMGIKGLVAESQTVKNFMKCMSVGGGVVMVLLFMNKEHIHFSLGNRSEDPPPAASSAIVAPKTSETQPSTKKRDNQI